MAVRMRPAVGYISSSARRNPDVKISMYFANPFIYVIVNNFFRPRSFAAISFSRRFFQVFFI